MATSLKWRLGTLRAPSRQQATKAATTLAAWLGIYAVMVVVGHFLPVPASDWYVHYLPRYRMTDYPPFVHVLLAFLPSLPYLSSLTLTALLFCLWRRQARPVQVLAAFTAMPLFWVLWLGQVDAVPMLGLALLPWGIPLVMIKPQVGVWYVWAWWRGQPRKWHIAVAVGAFIALSFLVWGVWPLKMTPPPNLTNAYNLSLWRLAWPLGLLAVAGALLERDPDRALALGSLGTPYLQGTGYILLLPVLARLHGWQLALAWLTSWAAVLTLVWGESARALGALFPLTVWGLLFWNARRGNVTGGLVPTGAHSGP